MSDRVRVDVADGVADVRLVRADKLNALDEAMVSALIDAGERLASLPGLRAVVLSGEGRAFCAGLDMGRMQALTSGPAGHGGGEFDLSGPRSASGANRAQQVVMVWRDLPVPVIAAVHGVAFGGGFQLALGADIRIVAPDARLSVMEIKWGLVPDMAGMVLMRRLLRDDVARELTYTGRVFGGEAAAALGLATRVATDPRTEALAMAREIASKSPHAVRAAKRLFALAAEGDQHVILRAEAEEQVALIGSPNQVEAVAANLEAREPRFADV